ncbi:amidophosphoribosyltransferase [Dyadobacter sediminis]|uniref:ComF family protein n=2 Tax=Dyadobacter sediminis TaxID=1493691 RepID=A0A5R9K882_9BACT|nr:ComF family protein [Dyadobacter sediminis]GGC10832.1 amidophosphoribosyltransferase [Dyadobacter sediminis]
MRIKDILHDFVDLIFPKNCEACHNGLIGNEETKCTSCRILLPRIEADGLNSEAMNFKFAGTPEIVSTHSFLLFTKKGKVQQLLHALKYKGVKEVGLMLGFMFGQEMAASGILPPAELIISVPLHEKKKKSRGYNQSDLLAEGFSNATGIPWSGTILSRTRHTATQTGKSKTERRENVKGVFSVKTEITVQSVIIMDDVLTTGATLEECVHALKTAGCMEFYILTIALAKH